MDQTDQYVSLLDLSLTCDETCFSEEQSALSVYQVQDSGSNTTYIMHVGSVGNPGDIIINKFDLDKKTRCVIAFTVYTEQQLKQVASTCVFNMIKIIVYHNNGQKLVPLCHIMLNLNFFDHVRGNSDITDFVSTKESKKQLIGLYFISLHYVQQGVNKCVRLENLKFYPGHKKVISKMMKHLFNQTVTQLIEKRHVELLEE